MSEREEFEDWALRNMPREIGPFSPTEERNAAEFIKRGWPIWKARADLAAERERGLMEALDGMVDAWDKRHGKDPFSQPDLAQREHAQKTLDRARDGQGARR